MKRYLARLGFRSIYPATVFVEENGRERALEHHVYHSPDGFAWGYGGSGPTELAKDILWDFTGAKPESATYIAFRDAFIEALPQDEGWIIEGWIIERWLRENSR